MKMPVIDRRVLAGVEELGRRASIDLVRELTVLFLADSAGRLTEVRAATKRGDLAAVRRSAHTFYGSASHLGACVLAAVCEELEVAARDGRADDVIGLVGRLEAESSRACEALRAIVRGGLDVGA